MKTQNTVQEFIRESVLSTDSVRVWFSRLGTIHGPCSSLYQAHINTTDRDQTWVHEVALALHDKGFTIHSDGSGGNGIVVSREGLRASKKETMIRDL